MCGDFNLEPCKEIKAIFKQNITPDKLSGLTDDIGIVTQEQLTEILNTSLAQKVDKVDGKQLSTNDFTNTLKSKLESVDTKAKVYSVNGQTGDVEINEYTLPTASTTTLGGVKVDGTTITINNGVISSSGGSGETGTTNYNNLLNKPQINGVELSGNKTLDSLGIQAKGDYALNQDISNLATKSELNNKVDKVSGKQLSTNDFTTDLKNKLDIVDVNAKVHSVNGQTGAVTIDIPDISILTPKVVEDLTSTLLFSI